MSAAELIQHPWLRAAPPEAPAGAAPPMPRQMKEMLKFDEQRSLRLLTLWASRSAPPGERR